MLDPQNQGESLDSLVMTHSGAEDDNEIKCHVLGQPFQRSCVKAAHILLSRWLAQGALSADHQLVVSNFYLICVVPRRAAHRMDCMIRKLPLCKYSSRCTPVCQGVIKSNPGFPFLLSLLRIRKLLRPAELWNDSARLFAASWHMVLLT